MKARINGILYNVNHGWELDLRNDEQFSSGTVAIQLNNNLPLKNYTYAELIESNDSYLDFLASSTLGLAQSDFDNKDIKTIYFDIDLQDVTSQRKLVTLDTFPFETYIEIDSNKIVLRSGANTIETGAILTTGRQFIEVARYDTVFEIFANGIQQETTGTDIGALGVTRISLGDGSIGDFKLYDFRMRSTPNTEDDLLQVAKGNYNAGVLFDNNTEFVYNDFEDLSRVVNKGVVFADLVGFNLGGKLVKKWNFFTQTPKAMWFDREENVYQHTTPLIELVEWFQTIKTPFMDLSNPLTGTAIFSGIQDMIDHIYNVAFPELENVNVGFIYSQDLLDAMVGIAAFDINIADGHLLSALSVVFSELSGRPTIEKIENGQITLGIKFKSKVNNEITFNDYDGYESVNPTKGYGTMGESRGLNVINNNAVDNKNAYLYTEDMAISVRSETVQITEENMVTQFFYPIEIIDSVILFELDNPSNTVDITDYVKLDSEWKLLKSKGFSSGTTTNYRQNTIQYKKGGTTLFGWGGTFDKLIFWNIFTWKEVIKSAQNNASIPLNALSTWEDISVVVNYRTRTPQTMFRVAKEDISNVNRFSTLQTNQSGNIVDLKRLTDVLHSDIQSSGNRLIFYTRSALESIDEALDRDLNDLDTLTNGFLKAIKVSGFEKSYTGVYTLSKDYQSITENLDISAKVRQYPIGDGTDTLRYYEDYIEWNLEGIENNESSLTADGIESFMNTFGKPTAIVKKNIDNVEFVSDEVLDENGVVQNLIIPVKAEGYRNTLKLFFGFSDPTFAYSKKEENIAPAVIFNQGIRYTKINGSLDTVVFKYGKKYTATDSITINQLPVVDATKYSGNPLIEVGASTSFDLNVPQSPRYEIINPGTTSVVRNEQWLININKPTSITKSIKFLYDDLAPVTYGTLTIQVETVNSLDVVTDLGTQAFTEGTAVTVNINAQIESIILTMIVNGTKLSELTYFNTITTSYLQETTVVSSGLQVSLGIGDILQQNHFIHNVFYQQGTSDIGEIIIGDEAMINNMLVGGNTKSLFVYESDRYDKLERTFAKGSLKGGVAGLITYTAQSMQCLSVIANGNAWAIGDTTTGKLLFAVNPPRTLFGIPRAVRKTVSHNHVHFRTGLVREH